jgi:hypothetical protein
MMFWVWVQIGSAVLLGLAASLLRRRRLSLRTGGLEFFTALLLPGVGPPAVALQLIFEALFRLTVRPAQASKLFEQDALDDPAARVPDPVEELRIGLSVAPFDEVLAAGESPAIDLALQRLAASGKPAALSCLKDALRSSRREVRVRARVILVRLEDRLVRVVRSSCDEVTRGRASFILACLSPEAGTAAHHLDRATQAFKKALGRSADPALRLELSRILMARGDYAGARGVLTDHVRHHPSDAEGYVGRMKASFALGDRVAVREDAARLASLSSPYAELARRWGG